MIKDHPPKSGGARAEISQQAGSHLAGLEGLSSTSGWVASFTDQHKNRPIMRILIIEDDLEAASFMVKGLEESGYTVDQSGDGEEGLAMAGACTYDLLIVDRMLPNRDGLDLVQALRARDDRTPVLFLSALGEVDDRVKGLRAGGDDYLAKPYAFSELLARIEALLRRSEAQITSEQKLKVGSLELDLLSRMVKRDDHKIELQPREFKLLEFLMRHAGRVVTRTMLLEGVWDYHFDPQTNVIDVHISRLRQKIDKGFETPLLHTVRGAGYCLKADIETDDHDDNSPA